MRSILVLVFTFSLVSCDSKKKPEVSNVPSIDKDEIRDLFKPLPDSLIDEEANKDLIALGKKLYFETKLSVNNKISCNTCHQIDNFGVDNEPTSPGHEGKRGERNSPTSFNAALHIAQFWDGRAKDLEEQALGPILNPVEMGMGSDIDVIKKLKKEKEYVKEFKQAFPNDTNSFTYENIGKAIAAFEKTLLTPSRFDDYLKGDESALNEQEKRGLARFVAIGCTNCHNGVAIGGNDYQMIGAVNAYETEDLGRFNVTKDEADKKVFKVPSLRNVVKTHPYFHDGSIASIEEAIKLMVHHQLGEEIDETFVEDVKAFLGSLTAKEPPQI